MSSLNANQRLIICIIYTIILNMVFKIVDYAYTMEEPPVIIKGTVDENKQEISLQIMSKSGQIYVERSVDIRDNQPTTIQSLAVIVDEKQRMIELQRLETKINYELGVHKKPLPSIPQTSLEKYVEENPSHIPLITNIMGVDLIECLKLQNHFGQFAGQDIIDKMASPGGENSNNEIPHITHKETLEGKKVEYILGEEWILW